VIAEFCIGLACSTSGPCYVIHSAKRLCTTAVLQSVSNNYTCIMATLAFKIQSTSQPEYLHQLISSQHPGSSMSLRSSTRPLLQAPCTQTAYGSRAFSSVVPAIWNNFPTSVIEADSLLAFCRRLKIHLFTVAFENSG